jgi:hypothetical protein
MPALGKLGRRRGGCDVRGVPEFEMLTGEAVTDAVTEAEKAICGSS